MSLSRINVAIVSVYFFISLNVSADVKNTDERLQPSNTSMSAEISENTEGAKESSEKAKLIIYRKKFTPPLNFKPLFSFNGLKAFHLPRNSHAEVELDPGLVTIKADWKVMHGVPDSELQIELQPGEVRYLNMATSLSPVIMGPVVNMDTKSNLHFSEYVDLSESRLITRRHKIWLINSGDFETPQTLDAKLKRQYQFSMDYQLLAKDIVESDLSEKKDLMAFINRHELYEDEVLSAIEDVILAEYKNEALTPHQVKIIATLCKTISTSGRMEYRDLIVEVNANAFDKKLQKYTEKYLSRYF